MIGNKYLKGFYEFEDMDTGINQLLEMLKSEDDKFIDSLYKPVDLEKCNDDEIRYLTIVVALIDYYLQILGREVPSWLRNDKLIFDKPYYHPKRLSDFEKVRLQYTNPSPFRNRNVYFDLRGIERV